MVEKRDLLTPGPTPFPPEVYPVSFIEDDWYDDFPLVWRDGWHSTAA
jgi:hypothetical protein